MSKQKKISDKAGEVLRSGKIADNVFYLPKVKLDRKVYDEVDSVLKALGAKWNRKLGGHKFEYDITEKLEIALNDGAVTNWKKESEYFPTPRAVANKLIAFGKISDSDFSWMEPSAGEGGILDVMRELYPNAKIFCNEKNQDFCDKLKLKGYNPTCKDWMEVEVFPVDFVVMNPPFRYEMDHIKHAYEFLKPGGQLLSVASNLIIDRDTKKGHEFREWVTSLGGRVHDVPEGSFKESGTPISTKILCIKKP